MNQLDQMNQIKQSDQNIRPNKIDCVRLGLMGYREALLQQMELVEQVSLGLGNEKFIFCSHPPIVTLGRGTQPGDVFGWDGDTLEVNRGGRATYHGPSQIIVYPILNLNLRGRDLHRYMRSLEDAVVMTLSEFGIGALGRNQGDATGVWIGNRKIASIGIGVRKWVSFHGLALNVAFDVKAFTGMKPCGYTAETMVSMEEILGCSVNKNDVENSLHKSLNARFIL